MTPPPTPPVLGNNGTSTRPYLIRALHEWCTDNGFTPYIAVLVGPDVKVPVEYVKNGEIVLNVGFEATTGLQLGNERIEFKARFGGSARDLSVPVDHVIAIYARENGQGMAFPAPADSGGSGTVAGQRIPVQEPTEQRAGMVLRLAEEGDKPSVPPKPESPDSDVPPEHPPAGGRPSLKRVK